MSSERRSYTHQFKLEAIEFAEKNGNRAAGKHFQVDEKSIREWRLARNKISLDIANSTPSNILSSKRKSYTAKFKLEAVEFADKNGNRAAGKRFGVDEKSVREWRSSRSKLQQLPATKRALRGQAAKWPALESKLVIWFTALPKSDRKLSLVAIQHEAKQQASTMGITDFKCGINWVYKFMKRNNLEIRTSSLTSKTKNNQDVMDEVNLDVPESKSVPSAVSTSTKGQSSVVSTCDLSLSDTKLKPMVNKKPTISKVAKEKQPKGSIDLFNENGLANIDIMKIWLENCSNRTRPSSSSSSKLSNLNLIKKEELIDCFEQRIRSLDDDSLMSVEQSLRTLVQTQLVQNLMLPNSSRRSSDTSNGSEQPTEHKVKALNNIKKSTIHNSLQDNATTTTTGLQINHQANCNSLPKIKEEIVD